MSTRKEARSERRAQLAAHCGLLPLYNVWGARVLWHDMGRDGHPWCGILDLALSRKPAAPGKTNICPECLVNETQRVRTTTFLRDQWSA